MGIYGWLQKFLPVLLIFLTVNSYSCIQPSVNAFFTSIQAWTVTSCNDVFNRENFFFLDFKATLFTISTYNTYVTVTLTFTVTIYLLIIILLILTPLMHALLNNTIPMAYTYLQYL